MQQIYQASNICPTSRLGEQQVKPQGWNCSRCFCNSSLCPQHALGKSWPLSTKHPYCMLCSPAPWGCAKGGKMQTKKIESRPWPVTFWSTTGELLPSSSVPSAFFPPSWQTGRQQFTFSHIPMYFSLAVSPLLTHNSLLSLLDLSNIWLRWTIPHAPSNMLANPTLLTNPAKLSHLPTHPPTNYKGLMEFNIY